MKFELALVTYRNLPFGVTTTPTGARPTLQLLPEHATGEGDPSAAIANIATRPGTTPCTVAYRNRASGVIATCSTPPPALQLPGQGICESDPSAAIANAEISPPRPPV